MKQLTLTEFIQKTIDEIETALPKGYAIDDAINFEICVTTTESKGGGIDLKVIAGKLSDDKEIMQRINFSIVNAAQKNQDFKKTGDNIIKYLGKGITEISKIADNNKKSTK